MPPKKEKIFPYVDNVSKMTVTELKNIIPESMRSAKDLKPKLVEIYTENMAKQKNLEGKSGVVKNKTKITKNKNKDKNINKDKNVGENKIVSGDDEKEYVVILGSTQNERPYFIYIKGEDNFKLFLIDTFSDYYLEGPENEKFKLYADIAANLYKKSTNNLLKLALKEAEKDFKRDDRAIRYVISGNNLNLQGFYKYETWEGNKNQILGL